MKKYISFAFLSAFTLFSKVSFADVCSSDPSCDDMGYEHTAADCNGEVTISCPFDENAKFCNKTNWKPCEVGHIYNMNENLCRKDEAGEHVVVSSTTSGTCAIMDKTPTHLGLSAENMTARVVYNTAATTCSQKGMRLPFYDYMLELYETGRIENDNPTIKLVPVYETSMVGSNAVTMFNIEFGTIEIYPLASAIGPAVAEVGVLCQSTSVLPCQSKKLVNNLLVTGIRYARGTREGAIAHSLNYAVSTAYLRFYPTVSPIIFLNVAAAKRGAIITSGFSVPTGSVQNRVYPKMTLIPSRFPVWAAPFYYNPNAPRHEIGIANNWGEAMNACEGNGGRLASKKGTAGFLNTVFRLDRQMSLVYISQFLSDYPTVYYARGEDEYGNYIPQCFEFERAARENMFDIKYDPCPDYYDDFRGAYICEYELEVY